MYGAEISSPITCTVGCPRERQRLQDARQELARHVAAHADRLADAICPGATCSGGNPRRRVSNVRADLAQAVDQVAIGRSRIRGTPSIS
jgi:hypothetical protein